MKTPTNDEIERNALLGTFLLLKEKYKITPTPESADVVASRLKCIQKDLRKAIKQLASGNPAVALKRLRELDYGLTTKILDLKTLRTDIPKAEKLRYWR